MNIKEIVENWLKKHKYDGLYNPNIECGCFLDDLMPCNEVCSDCESGYKKPDPTGEYDWLIGPKG